MAKYGNRRCYRIDDIRLNKNPTSTFPKDGQEITYVEYFKRQYNIDIADLTQPLILRLRKKVEESEVYLVPELMTLTGLDESMRSSSKNMNLIAQFTRLAPEKRLGVSRRLANYLNDNEKVRAVTNEFQFSISRTRLPSTRTISVGKVSTSAVIVHFQSVPPRIFRYGKHFGACDTYALACIRK